MNNEIIKVETELELPNSLESQAPSAEKHFTDSQDKSKVISRVSSIWEKQCISWDNLVQQLTLSEDKNDDVHCQLGQLELIDVAGVLKLQVELSGKDSEYSGLYNFGDQASNQLCGTGMLRLGSRMLTLGENIKEKEHINNLYIQRFTNWRSGVGSHRQLFVRLRNDQGFQSVRAMLSDTYGNVPHTFLADVVRKEVGESALISHFDDRRFGTTGGDFCRYNVLIPDSIRAEEDSQYGGMHSVSNSEVGTGRFLTLPSIFRAICMNGCIWGSRSDKVFVTSRVHKGKINLDDLRIEITTKLQAAIPLLPVGIDNMLNLKSLDCPNTMQLLGFSVLCSKIVPYDN